MGKTRKYMAKLYRQSNRKIRKMLGTKGDRVILASKIVTAAIGISLLVALNLLPSNQPVYQIVSTFFWADIAGFLLLWIATPFLTIYGIPKEALKRDQKKKKKIGRLKEKKAKLKKRISRKNIKLLLSSPKKVISTEQVELWIIIENDSGKELSNYYARIEKVGFQKEQNAKIEPLEFPDNMKLRWPDDSVNFNRDMERPISPGDTGEISIIRTSKNFFKLDTILAIQNTFKEIGYYFIVLTVAGVVDKIGIHNCIQVAVDYKGGTEIEIIEIKEHMEQND